ncbi:MAG: sulfate transporter, partial [Deltaproteobacteria bacterium]|nr:sulfate transporter [Deltaproteobacteria bacterium]
MSALPFLDLRGIRRADVANDALSGLTVTFMSIPQGVAYAMIAGLPPVMGLYAACIPAIVGAVFRSSRHVITGPSNALSLLVGEGLAAQAGLDPIGTALLLALLIGGMQVAAGVLRLGVLVDYISLPVVLGYITGAGVLIGVGQLPNLTQTAGGSGHIINKFGVWGSHLQEANLMAIAVGAATAAFIVILRKIDKRIPGPILVLVIATVVSWLMGLREMGMATIADQAPVPTGLPPLTVPDLDGWSAVLSLAVAGTVLSLVESSSVARAVSAKTGQRLAVSTEFVGQGLANVAAAFTGGY